MTHEMPCDDCGESIPILFARRRFERSNSFNEAVLLHREHVEPTLFEGECAA